MAIGIPPDAWVIAGATFFGAGVGAILPEYLRTRKRRDDLRRALKAELTSMTALANLEVPMMLKRLMI